MICSKFRFVGDFIYVKKLNAETKTFSNIIIPNNIQTISSEVIAQLILPSPNILKIQ